MKMKMIIILLSMNMTKGTTNEEIHDNSDSENSENRDEHQEHSQV